MKRSKWILFALTAILLLTACAGGGSKGSDLKEGITMQDIVDKVEEAVPLQMPGDIAVQQRTGRDHFRIEPGMAADQAMEITAMPVCPVEHWSD